MTESIEIIDGVEMYRISDVDEIAPFLMTIVSNSDLWMFVSSAGGLTAGRVDPATSLFPYETDDRLHSSTGRVGPMTLLRVGSGEDTILWEPFTARSSNTRRSLFKSLLGNAVVFQEEHLDLGLQFQYRWAPSDRFGWIRTATLTGSGADTTVEILDGLLGVMPWGIGVRLQQGMSNLANAYRRSELFGPDIGLFTLEAQIVDRPEPAEALRANSVWSTGLEGSMVTVDAGAVDRARHGLAGPATTRVTGRPGAFLLNATVHLESGQRHRWHIAADVAHDHAGISRLETLLESGNDHGSLIDADINRSSTDLGAIVATSDSVQHTGSQKMDAHHLANTLFNVMRGGTFGNGYQVEAERFAAFLEARNRPLLANVAAWLEQLPATLPIGDLRRQAAEHGDPNLIRLVDEYLPLGFSRRHGDPSRPWNHFAIRVRDQQGAPLLSYQGNWRDIFQNWEALGRSFPAFLPSMVAKFLNASTADGFNPYRITSDGIDWEVIEPDNPWSGIGYWGDHQIVYLLRLLQALDAHSPGELAGALEQRAFSFADVPYRIVPFEQMILNPKATVDFAAAAEAATLDRVSDIGVDGKLLADGTGAIIHVTLLEKLLIPALAKLSNFVPRGGIWMNTQRPEWNDANNALVGYGLSMVTLAYLRRYLEFLADLTAEAIDPHPVSPEVIEWLEAITAILEANLPPAEDAEVEPRHRAQVLHQLGSAFDGYRSAVYLNGLSPPEPLEAESLGRLFQTALTHLDDALRAARRPDRLFDAYNLLRLSTDGSTADVERLPQMLEGQVAAISSGLLDGPEVVALIEALYDSELYREDVDSFVLYPADVRPAFMERNRIPQAAAANPLLAELLESESEEVVARDGVGNLHFNADFRNAGDLNAALDQLTGPDIEPLVAEHRAAILDLFEEVFDHHAFTGRSATMYAYEGIGSVYWHMVAKLLVAVQEQVLSAPETADGSGLIAAYERIRAGLGFNKSAAEYGAFPTDPYSHTPAHVGAQQPGMTGQVKEELLARWAELGLVVDNGSIRFDPRLLHHREFGTEPTIRFTLCQVPVILHLAEAARMVITFQDGTDLSATELILSPANSREIFDRTGAVQQLDVHLDRSTIRS